MTHLCISIFVTNPAQAQRDIALAAEAGADMVELRIDTLGDAASIEHVLRQAALPCIVTCRPMWEGGRCALSDSERLTLLMTSASYGAAYVDVELKSLPLPGTVDARPRDQRPGLIVSTHHFQGRPDRMHNLITQLNASTADINKVVWTARSIRDNLEAFEILQHRNRPTIALCMGEAGLISRVLAKKFGAFLSFTALPGEVGTAPGQISIADMKKLYRWDAIGPKSKVYGVVAQPVIHSMSPAIHNAAFDATGFDGVYLPLLVEKSYESFKAFMESFLNLAGLDLFGLSITIPHKENALRYLQETGAEIEPLAVSIGTVNTILIDKSKIRLRGTNTDYAAILDCITTKLGIGREGLKGVRVAVIGAGGTGRTAVAALAHCGARVEVYNRTRERAELLAEEFGAAALPMEKLGSSSCAVYINTTSVGMYPNVDQTPLGDVPPQFTHDTLVFDTIYNPMKTQLLEYAQSRGAKTIGGVEMFVRQAAAQFEAWTGIKAPAEVMRRVIESRLGH